MQGTASICSTGFAGRARARTVITQFLLFLALHSIAASPSTGFTSILSRNTLDSCVALSSEDNSGLQRKADETSREPYQNLLSLPVLVTGEGANRRDGGAEWRKVWALELDCLGPHLAPSLCHFGQAASPLHASVFPAVKRR